MKNRDYIIKLPAEKLASYLLCPYDAESVPVEKWPCVGADGRIPFCTQEQCRACIVGWLGKERYEKDESV